MRDSRGFFVVQVGAPPEIAHFLEGIRQESDLCNRHTVTTCLGVDPELDEFMVTPSFSKIKISLSFSLFSQCCFCFVDFTMILFLGNVLRYAGEVQIRSQKAFRRSNYVLE